MKYIIFISFFFVTIIIYPNIAYSQNNYWQQKVDNEIYVKLFPSDKKIIGRQKITYQNNSPDSLSEIYFHLYANAYTDSSILSEQLKKYYQELPKTEKSHGWIRVDSVQVNISDRLARIDTLKTIHDGTILKLCFSPSIKPKASAVIELQFESKLRKYTINKAKGGYSSDQFEFCHWYPKACVYDKNGWNAIPYHLLGEFYGEFGTFDVTINVPDNYVVAAPGGLERQESKIEIAESESFPNTFPTSENSNPNYHEILSKVGTKRLELTYHAEKIHNFAWACSQTFVKESDNWNGIEIEIYYREKSRAEWENTVLADAKQALRWLNESFGDFPYPKIIICEQIYNDGGMEYPMLVLLNPPSAELILHEVAHQYFYGAVANNEITNGWLDEGLVTYQTLKFLEHTRTASDTVDANTPINNLLVNQFEKYNIPNDIELNSLYNYLYSSFEKPLSYPCYKLNNLYLYTFHVYTKPSKFFEMLEYTVGSEAFDTIIKEYYREWQFKHVDAHSLQSVCERVSNTKLDWLFDQWLHTTNHVDYACTDITSRKNNDGMWDTEITVERNYSGISKVEAEVTTKSGEKYRQKWLGTEKEKIIRFTTSSKVTGVILDPDDKILDMNRLNNSRFDVAPFIYHNFYSMYQLPRNAYSLFLWPRVWYNDLDGAKIGLQVYGSYLNRYYVTRNQFWFNTKSRSLDFNLGYSMPWESIDKNLWRHIYIKSVEGRREVNVNLNYNSIKHFNATPENIYRIGFRHLEATNTEYTLRSYRINDKDFQIQTWDQGRIHLLYFDFSKSRVQRPYINHDFTLELSHNNIGSDYNYIKLFYENKFASRRSRHYLQLFIRNFAGWIYSEYNDIPVQSQFWIGEGNPVDRFKYYYLRSPGAYPRWLNYYLPGDGGLRGYTNTLSKGTHPFTSDRIIATNIDLTYEKSELILPKMIRNHLGSFKVALFFDAAYAHGDYLDRSVFMDAGFRVQFVKKFLDQNHIFRFDFPLWMSQPKLDEFAPAEPNWKFRWRFSFQ